jgi:hypothetical protein
MRMDRKLEGFDCVTRVARPWFVVPWLHERLLVSDKSTR